MKVFFLYLFLSLNVGAATYAQKFTLDKRNISINYVFKEIRKQTGYNTLIDVKLLDKIKPIDINVKNVSIQEALKAAIMHNGLTYAIIEKNIIISEEDKAPSKIDAIQQDFTVEGKVLDDKGLALPGVTIQIKGMPHRTVKADENGFFKVQVFKGSVLILSYMGFQSQNITIANQEKLTIIMTQNQAQLEEVVVTALGIKRSEKGLGYAIQKVSGDQMNVVKNVDATSGLIGKIAGLHIQSSSEFNEAPTMSLRGESPLLVIDGVPYTNISLRDIAPDDIESINVLKGATASALYGSRGGSGAVIVTTKKGNKKGGLEVAVNSNTMFEAGYLALPKVQKSYSSGGAGKYGSGDFVWGDKLDIGRTALQYDPYTYEWGEAPLVSKGKDNLTNFLEPGFITNNNIGISHQGEKGSFRSSLTHVYNKGQYPGSKLNKLTYTVGGDMKVDKFTFEGNMTYNKRFYPNNSGTGYGSGGYIYNLLVWSGPEFDIRDYKNYWVKGKEGIQQNWMDNNWYDNPYFIANEKRHSNDYDVTNGFMSMKYDVKPWLNFTLRSGFDYYSDKEEWKYAKSLISNKKGYYKMDQETAFSSNTDLIIMGNHKIGKLGIDALIGSTLYYRQGSNVWGETKNGLSIPGFYSINASVDPATTGQGGSKKQVNSIFGKATLSWDNMFYVDITARNDWSSTLPSSTRSYFYPSISSSLILSEIFEKPQWLDLWKLRGSWTKTKNDIGVYETNNTYSMSTNIWDGLNAAYYPGSIRGFALRPESSRSYEIGTAANFLKNRLWLDLTYYNKLRYDFATRAPLSEASSFSSIYLNTDEQLEHKGVEVTIGGKIMKNDSFSWNTLFNWALDRQVYKKLDEKYSSKYPWAGVGERTDVATTSHYIWDTDSKGNIVHGSNGLPINIRKIGKMGYSSPDWVWGFTNSFQYKHFMLDITFDGSVGGVAYNRTEQAMWNSGSHIESDNKWRYDQVVNGLNNYIGKGVQVVSGTIERDEYGQVISDNRTYAPNDKEVSYENYIRQYQGDSYESAPQNFFSKSFFKLREVAISYNVPTTFAKKLGVNDFRIAAVGNNLFLWTKEFKYSDPDKGSDNLNSPSMRYLGFNFRFSF